MWWQYLIIGVLSLFGVIVVVDLIAGAIVMTKLSKPHKRDNNELHEYELAEKKFNDEWLKIPFEKLELQSDYNYKLYARLYMAKIPTNNYIIALHGHNSSSLSQLKYLSIFKDMGFNVFIPDHRRSGISEGDTITFGCYEKHDTIKWMDELQQRNPRATFGIFGESMGAATATMITSMDRRIRFLIEYCGYANFKNLIMPRVKSLFVYYLVKPSMKIMARIIGGFKIGQTDARKAMQKVKVPALIMHSKADKLVPVCSAYTLQKANPKAEMILFDDAPHARSYMYNEQQYRNAIETFIISHGVQPAPSSPPLVEAPEKIEHENIY
ncbi:MAG: alpha/beta hydrolase [Bacillota bacterium]